MFYISHGGPVNYKWGMTNTALPAVSADMHAAPCMSIWDPSEVKEG
jgi:hypothetical protein